MYQTNALLKVSWSGKQFNQIVKGILFSYLKTVSKDINLGLLLFLQSKKHPI